MKNNRVAKYNSSWQIIGRESVRRAISKVYKGRAMFMDKETGQTFDFENWLRLDPTDEFVTVWPYGRIRKPNSIVCVFYKGLGMSSRNEDPKFSRWNIFVRDGGVCCFCGKKLQYTKGGFTFDHLYPKSLGGEKDWTNIVLACHSCNNDKANKTLSESDFKLLKKPYKPSAQELREKSIRVRQQILQEEIAEGD